MLVSIDGLMKFQDNMVPDAHGRELAVGQFFYVHILEEKKNSS